MKVSLAERVTEALNTICPVVGVSIGNRNDRTTWTFQPAASATVAQVSNARAYLLAAVFDTSPDDMTEGTPAILADLEKRVAALEKKVR